MSTNIQNIVVLGAGESGVGAAILAQSKGHKVFLAVLGCWRERDVVLTCIHDICRNSCRIGLPLGCERDVVLAMS